jgi:sporulation protein YtfJ
MDNHHPIENLMRSTMESIKDMIDVNTVVGEPVTAYDGTVIIPISKVSFGFASGGTEFENTREVDKCDRHPFGGGSGAGISIRPVGFLVVKGDSIRMLPVDQTNTYDKIVDTVPQIIDMFKEMFKDKAKDDDCCVDTEKKESHNDKAIFDTCDPAE